jgi:hypothetical protein
VRRGGPKGSSFIVLAALPDDVRQHHELTTQTAPFAIDRLIAANGTVAGVAWVARGATWTPIHYDEGDR